ncbi:DNA/RNA non-specific endonuclease [Streptomyces sp. NBC_01803]|uniref:DNA/RNA non-specific endonuclease n=1 Tax=Streptomyces sp. NBC_01803 TaxID=2975946 RepID=UPI002DDC05C0|nr:DNA/RNA non-specific endonuclease [Streptomyces sp. NBC_01803]WSA45382.1 DNA/RNA non-specific endonuclease [Streptomyces sp. NBC_01803]
MRASDWSPVDMDSDPTPGRPDEVRELAEELQEFADDVGEALGKIRGMASDRAVLEWAGLTADAFRTEFDGVPENLTKLRTSYDMAADALARYWPKLENAQALADRALERAIAAQADLRAAQGELADGQDWVSRAGEEAERLQDQAGRETTPEPPSEADVRNAVRDHQAAQAAATAAQGRVSAAEEALSAARELARQAQEMREEAARECARDIDAASDAGIHNRRWWERAIDWVRDNWDTIVDVCRLVVAVLGVVVMIIGGPLAWVVLAAALIVLADTLVKYARGQASLLDVAFAALDCIPGMKGLTTLGGLARGIRSLAATGMRGLARGAVGAGRRMRQNAVEFGRRVLSRDPVDLATGEVAMPAVDVELPGILPLTVERHHISTYRYGRWFGTSWASTLDQRLVLDPAGVRLITHDGMVLEYPVPFPDLDTPVLPVEGPRWGLTWDGNPGSPMTVHQPETGRTLHFAPVAGRAGTELPLTSITDRNTNRVELHYDKTGAPCEVTHSGGYRVGVTTVGDRVTALVLLSSPDQPTLFRYGYDESGNLSEVSNSSDQPSLFTYDAQRRMTGWQDRNGYWYRYEYDPEGRCVFATGTDRALEWRYAYDPESHRTTVVNSLGDTTVYQFNDSFQLVAETDPLGNTTTKEWDRYDRALTITDPLGRTTRYGYDEAGRVEAITRPDGAEINIAHNELGLVTELRDADGTVWQQSYDAAGHRAVLVDPAGNRTRYTHHANGGLRTVTDALGNTTHLRVDGAGLVTMATDPLGEAIRYERDALGRTVRIVDPLGAETRLGWTVEGKVSRRTGPTGAEEAWEWDAEGNLLAHTDANGGITSYSYGPFDLPVSQTGPDGARYLFSRDTELRLTSVTDPTGRTWNYEYDAAGHLTAEQDFDGRVTTYTVDAIGQVTARTNAAGQSVRLTYDALGHVIRKTTAEGGTLSYAHDAAGRVVRAASPDVDLTRTYDPLGRLITETVNGRTLTLSHDALGQLASRITPTAHTSTWTYDPVGRPLSLTSGDHTLGFDHDPTGRETRRRIGASLVLTQSWDPVGNLANQVLAHQPASEAANSGRVLHQRNYSYRPDGYLTACSDPGGNTRYTLDIVGRVTGVDSPVGSESYTYDARGDQTAASWTATESQREAIGERVHRGGLLLRSGRIRYEYDAAGRVILRQKKNLSRKPDTWRYTWDSEDRLTDVTAPDGTVWRYLYDPFGRRVAKQRLGADGETVAEEVSFTWHDAILIEQKASSDAGADTVTHTWDYKGFQPVAQTERPLEYSDQAEFDRRFFAIVTDLVGSPTHLVTDTGDAMRLPHTTLWGAATTDPGGAPLTPLRFPGQYADEETGWHYNYQRHYDPCTARYTSPDPLGLTPAPNPYTYPHNPYRWIDILGLSPYTPRYGELDDFGRATGVEVTLTTGNIGGRTRPRVDPAGWVSGQGYNRAHLLGAQLGGSNTDIRNFVTMHQYANTPIMRGIENEVRAAVEAGQRVDYRVTPVYRSGSSDPLPLGVSIEAEGSGGLNINQTVLNQPRP